MWQTLRNILIGVMSLLVIGGIATILYFNHENNKLEEEKSSIKVPDEMSMTNQMNPDDVKKYEGVVEDIFERYKRNDLKDQSPFDYSNSGINALHTMFSAPGISPPNEKTSQKDYLKFYRTFNCEIKKIGGTYDSKDNVILYIKYDMKYNDKSLTEQYDLVKLRITKDGKVLGGSMYGKDE